MDEKEMNGMADYFGQDQQEEEDPAEQARQALLDEVNGKIDEINREKDVLKKMGCWDEKNEKTLEYYESLKARLEKDQEGGEEDGSETAGYSDDNQGGDRPEDASAD